MERSTIFNAAVIHVRKQSAPLIEHDPFTCAYNSFPLNIPYFVFF
jgi:hypothetical protein